MSKRRVGGQLRKVESTSQLCPLRDERDDASVVGAQELPQHEEGEELHLRVVVPREPVAPYSGSAACPAASASRATLTADFGILRIRALPTSPKADQLEKTSKGFNRAKRALRADPQSLDSR
jgi:hypothetical protein